MPKVLLTVDMTYKFNSVFDSKDYLCFSYSLGIKKK